MTIDAKIDVGCGEYKWKVEAPKKDEPEEPEKPGLGDLQCTDRHKHRDVQDGAQDTWAQAGCKWYGDGKTMKPGDKEVYWGPPGVTGASHMNYKISWKEDCEGFDEQSLGNPVEGEDVDCYSLMRENYKSCRSNPNPRICTGNYLLTQLVKRQQRWRRRLQGRGLSPLRVLCEIEEILNFSVFIYLERIS